MRISDWSSDVCSSDLLLGSFHGRDVEELDHRAAGILGLLGDHHPAVANEVARRHAAAAAERRAARRESRGGARDPPGGEQALGEARKSVVEGKRVTVCVGLGGSRIINKKNT